MLKRAISQQAKEDRREALLGCALNEFFERGFASARIEDIAKRAGVSKGTLYLYFNSKQALFDGLVEAVAIPRLAEIKEIVESNKSFADTLDAMAKQATHMLTQTSLPKLMKIMIGESNNFPDTVKAYRRNVLDKVLAVFTALLTSAQQRGEISLSDPQLGARMVIAPIAFSGIWEVVFGNDPDAYVDLDAFFALHIHTLKQSWIKK